MTPFSRFVAASGLTNLGDGVATLAWAWLATHLTRDPMLVASVPVALRLPWFLGAVPAGLVTDRVDRRHLILWMDAVRAAAFLIVTLAVWASLPLSDAPERGVAMPWLFALLLIAALVVGLAEVFRDNAAQTMLPALVPHNTLERANGRLWSVELVGNQLAGPAMGALLIAWALPLPFGLNALAYAIALVLVWQVRGSFRPEATKVRNWRRELREGFDFLAGAHLLRTLALITGAWNLLFSMVTIALVLHVQENLGLGAPAYGLILSAGAAGGIIGGLWGGIVVRWLGPGKTAQWMLAVSAPAFLAMALASGPVTLAIVMVAFQFSGIVWNMVSVSYRQRFIPNALLGRVNSLYRLLAWGMMPVGLLLSGLSVRLAEHVVERSVALTVPFGLAAVGALALVLVGWRALGRGFAETGTVRPHSRQETGASA
ncbi:MFS transporter [Algicella marina]|uniref:MFS transporter n=1 Tax=Algicella marina TaxID=2683284 RepID=A0A6P1T6Y8_9RHOB|nr:MFS transporter [Algicella marina]